MTENIIGRPKIITEQILSKLIEGYTYGFTDRECALYVGISPATLYRYCEENKDFGEQKEDLKNSPQMKAKMNIIKKIEQGDVTESKRWLERKGGKEFNIRISMKNEPIPTQQSITDEEKAQVEKLLELNVFSQL